MRETTRSGEAAPALIASFFLVAPIALLLGIAREHHAPSKDDLNQDYLRAVRETVRPDASQVSHSLVSVNLTQPITVVTWMRRKQVADYEGKTTAPPYKDTWVTVVPKLRSFCQDYVKSQGTNPEKLNLRLQQRLGLPPDSSNDSFVELTVDPKDVSRFFRPCGDPSPNTSICQPASPPKPVDIWKSKANLKAPGSGNNDELEQYWLLSNYYWSFASPHPYPWTSLGYTFDWAPQEEESEDFVRWGESEFVIPAGAPIQFVSATDTAAYCTPQ
jgi:hypothetical protein